MFISLKIKPTWFTYVLGVGIRHQLYGFQPSIFCGVNGVGSTSKKTILSVFEMSQDGWLGEAKSDEIRSKPLLLKKKVMGSFRDYVCDTMTWCQPGEPFLYVLVVYFFSQY